MTSTTPTPVVPTWNRQPGPESPSRFDDLDVEGFTIHDGTGSTRHYERDIDLFHKTREALGSGSRQAALLVTLGIDGYDARRVQLDYNPGAYENAAHVIDEAISALEVIRDQLDTMRAVGAPRPKIV